MRKPKRKPIKRKANTTANSRNFWPLALAVTGVSAILIGIYIAKRRVIEAIDEGQIDVENYEVKDKPYIYGICE